LGELFEAFEVRKAVSALMDLARSANKYFNDQEPWLTVASDPSKCATSLNICLQTVKTLAILQSPILPFSAQKTWQMLNLGGQVEDQSWDDAGHPSVKPGHRLGKPEILFPKIEDADIERENAKLRKATPLTIEKEKEVTEEISFEEFRRLDIRTAKVLAAERVENTDKLLKLQIDIGGEQRQIVAGIAQQYDADQLAGKTIVVVANLAPAKIRGVESKGMLLAAVTGRDELALLTTDKEFPVGASIQ
jgi:methionyl-tRNA synthetase